MPDINYSTLANMRTKVRRLTRSPSVNQLSDAQIDEYVNNFVLYDFPQQLRMFALRKTLTFYLQPNVDIYENNTVNASDPLYNFINKYSSVHGPVYIAGYNAFFSQSREQFFAIFPQVRTITKIGTGTGIATVYAGTLSNFPVLQNNVMFSSIGTTGLGIALVDTPNPDPVTGYKFHIGTLRAQNNPIVVGTMDYNTGQYSFNMTAALGEDINAQTIYYQPSRPQAILFYENKFTVRPVPDQPYAVNAEVYIRPTELLLAADMPELTQWWQYIAYGASKKVFEDRMDMESIQMIMPELKKQETLAIRQSIMEMSNERTATIYTEQTSMGTLSGGGSNWGGF